MLLRARRVLPICSPPIDDGAIWIEEGVIQAVGRYRDLADRGKAWDQGEATLLPGLINSHAHLELTHLRGRLAPQPFWDWIDRLIALRRESAAPQPDAAAVRAGAEESVGSGVTCVADVSRTGDHWDALHHLPLRSVRFVELISGAQSRPANPEQLAERLAALESAKEPRTHVGISPHSLYNVTAADLCACVALATQHCMPLMIHVAETSEEVDWLASGGGRVAEFLQHWNLPNAAAAPHGDFIDRLDAAGAFTAGIPLALVHVNYITSEQITRLAARRAHVVFCPRAHAFFGHPPHPWRQLLAAGVNVCLGTDGLACNDTLSILSELRCVAAMAPDVEIGELWAMATRRAAAALGLEEKCGSIKSGLFADLVLVDGIRPGDRCGALVETSQPIRRCWASGRCTESFQGTVSQGGQ